MSGLDVAQRHAQISEAAMDYLRSPRTAAPAVRVLGPRLGGAAVLVVGGHSLGLGGGREPLQLEVVVQDQDWDSLQVDVRSADLSFRDAHTTPPTDLRVRSQRWLGEQLGHPEGLWLRQRACLAQDPRGEAQQAVDQAWRSFRQGIPALVAETYRSFRQGFEEAPLALEPLGRTVLVARAAHAALSLGLLARGEPFPPARWLCWQVSQVVAEGEQLVVLAGRAAAQGGTDRAAYAQLRRLVDEILDGAGYGERVVRAHAAQA